jgi:hypothetical protein
LPLTAPWQLEAPASRPDSAVVMPFVVRDVARMRVDAVGMSAA